MEREYLQLKKVYIKVALRMIKFMVFAHFKVIMEKNIRDNGKIVIKVGKVNIHGQMEIFIRVNTMMIRDKDMVL